MIKKLLFSGFIMAFLVIGTAYGFFHFPERAQAQTELVLRPSGGPIITVVPCNTGLWITVGPPGPASLMIMPTTLVYLYKIFHPAGLVLGGYFPITIPCVVGVIPVGGGFKTMIIGTSL